MVGVLWSMSNERPRTCHTIKTREAISASTVAILNSWCVLLGFVLVVKHNTGKVSEKEVRCHGLKHTIHQHLRAS